jgi:hypothetical protein
MGQAIVVNPYHQKCRIGQLNRQHSIDKTLIPSLSKELLSYVLYIGVGFDTLQFVVYYAKSDKWRNLFMHNQDIDLRS